jgi:hypothetical protein
MVNSKIIKIITVSAIVIAIFMHTHLFVYYKIVLYQYTFRL